MALQVVETLRLVVHKQQQGLRQQPLRAIIANICHEWATMARLQHGPSETLDLATFTVLFVGFDDSFIYERELTPRSPLRMSRSIGPYEYQHCTIRMVKPESALFGAVVLLTQSQPTLTMGEQGRISAKDAATFLTVL